MANASLSRNIILSRLSASERAILAPHLEPVDLELRQRLEPPNKPIEHVYFVEDGIVSVVARGSPDVQVEVGIVGHEGLTGLPVIMGTDRSPHDVFVQAAGHGQRMTADALRRAMEISPGFRASVLLFAHVFTVQAGSTALANAKASIAERLSRWILMAQDRLESHNVPLTHEFLAIMIGTPRPGVTIALNDLKHRGLITTSRGLISVVDRSGLERASNGFYGGPEREFRRLFS